MKFIVLIIVFVIICWLCIRIIRDIKSIIANEKEHKLAKKKEYLQKIKDNEIRCKEIRRVAAHEAGHTLLVWYCTSVISLDQITITSAEGGKVVYSWDITDYDNQSINFIWARLVIVMAGFAAEDLVHKECEFNSEKDLQNGKNMQVF